MERRTPQIVNRRHGAPSARLRAHPAPAGVRYALACATVAAGAYATACSAAPDQGEICEQTARLVVAACRHSAADDMLIAQAKCINIGDRTERKDCMMAAAEDRDDHIANCDAQVDLRDNACDLLGPGRYDPQYTAADFFPDASSIATPNPYFPITPGHRWEYRSAGGEVDTVEATSDTKLIDGVTAVVFRDIVSVNGDVREATDDWFAQARDGNVWYFGEEVKDYEFFSGDRRRLPELVSIDGSFKVGRDGDKAGVIFQAHPQVGQAYLEEFSLGNAEDVTEILSVTYSYGANADLDRHVPRALADRFCRANCIVTKNYSLIEPGDVAYKYYGLGVGAWLEVERGSGVTSQLTDCNFDPRCVGLASP